MAEPYVPSFAEENLEILMERKNWFDDDMRDMPDDQVYVRYDEHIQEFEELEQRVVELEDENWDLLRKVEEIEGMYEEQQERADSLESERDDLLEKIAELENANE